MRTSVKRGTLAPVNYRTGDASRVVVQDKLRSCDVSASCASLSLHFSCRPDTSYMIAVQAWEDGLRPNSSAPAWRKDPSAVL